jgi:arylsulfatase A-like enzyme
MKRRVGAVVLAILLLTLVGGAGWWTALIRLGGPPSPAEQACGIPKEWLDLARAGYLSGRSGDVAILPRTPAYIASEGGGWSHSGPWPYLQRVPLVFYGPGFVEPTGDVTRPVTLADVAPTLATMLKGSLSGDGTSLDEVARLTPRSVFTDAPRLVVVVVWDGGGWNTLEQWPDAWPNLAGLMSGGVSYTNATVGSSPSVTPSVHTTLGTGFFPSTHGITGVPIRDSNGEVVDAFLEGESSRLIEVPTLAERWDEQTNNAARIGMIGYEPWHLGMIGKGAEKPGGDHDDAVWLDVETNEWITNPDHYRAPPVVVDSPGLDSDLAELDAADGRVDDAWGDLEILDDPSRVEETPAFVRYHTRAMIDLINAEGYGSDDVTDLLFTNYKQIDRLGHYFNMASDRVREVLVETDRQLGELVTALDDGVGEGKWVLVVTADHGQQPDAPAIDGFGINPNYLEADIDAHFGANVTRAVWPTEVFLDLEKAESEGVDATEVARYLADYRFADNVRGWEERLGGTGTFAPRDRLFDLAVPSADLAGLRCGSD